MKTFAPLKFKRLASEWKTELADTNDLQWTPMEDEPMETIKQIVAFFVKEALLNMRRLPSEPPG